MTGSSINFKPVQSASQSVNHADRTVKPTYLLTPDVSLGTICVFDDKGKVAQTLDAKMALASRQARAAKNFSPVWEGVLNLPRPALNSKNFNVAEYKKHCIEITKSWIEEYQKATNHKVLRADIHLDEGHIENGEVLLNAHAHIIADKTNDKGKVFIIDRKEMRALQTLTAEVTGLARGQSSHVTGRKHLNPGAYKAIVKTHGLEIQKAKATTDHIRSLFQADTKIIDDLKAQIAKIEADYKAEREAMKASGEAKQADYQRVKKERDEAIATLKLAIKKIEATEQKVTDLEAEAVQAQAQIALLTPLAAQVPELAATVTSQADQITQLKAQYKLDREAMKASGTATQPDYQALKKAHEAELAKLKADAMAVITPLRTEVKNMKTKITQLQDENAKLAADVAKFAAMANNYQTAKSAGTPAHLIIPNPKPTKTAQEPPKEVQAPTPLPMQEKSISEAIKASWEAMLAWIKGKGGVLVDLDTQQSSHFGPVVQMDDLHCVQSTGRGKHVVHKLAQLNLVPALDDSKTEISYRGGVGQVKGQSLGRGGRAD
jgi:DNA-binding protein